MARYRARQHQNTFRLRLSTMLLIVAVVTHSHLGLSLLLRISEFFHSDLLEEVFTAFSHMTDRLLGIAVIAALFFGVRALRRLEYATQYWLEALLGLALILLMHGPGGNGSVL